MIMLAPRLVRLVSAYWRAGLTLAAPLLLTAVPLSGAQENVSALWTLYTILVTPAPPRHCYPTHAPAQVMAVFWIFELMPLPITSLLPLVLLPLAGVASTDEVARNYLKVDRDGTLMSYIHDDTDEDNIAGDQPDVRGQLDHGDSGGAQRLPPETQPQPDRGGGDQPEAHHAGSVTGYSVSVSWSQRNATQAS